MYACTSTPQIIIYCGALSRIKRIILNLFDLVLEAMHDLELARGCPSVH